MKINPITNQPFTVFELAEVATRYYDDYRSRQIISGFERCIATDGLHAMFVLPNYKPMNADECVFYCSVRRGSDARNETHGTGTMLFRTYTEGPLDPALNTVSTNQEELIRAAHRALNPRFFYRNNRVCYYGKWYVPEDGKITKNFRSRTMNIINRAVSEGYELYDNKTIEDTMFDCIDHILERNRYKSEFVVLDSSPGLEHVEYDDGNGFRYRYDGKMLSDKEYMNTYFVLSPKNVFVENKLADIIPGTPIYVQVCLLLNSSAHIVSVVKKLD